MFLMAEVCVCVWGLGVLRCIPSLGVVSVTFARFCTLFHGLEAQHLQQDGSVVPWPVAPVLVLHYLQAELEARLAFQDAHHGHVVAAEHVQQVA